MRQSGSGRGRRPISAWRRARRRRRARHPRDRPGRRAAARTGDWSSARPRYRARCRVRPVCRGRRRDRGGRPVGRSRRRGPEGRVLDGLGQGHCARDALGEQEGSCGCPSWHGDEAAGRGVLLEAARSVREDVLEACEPGQELSVAHDAQGHEPCRLVEGPDELVDVGEALAEVGGAAAVGAGEHAPGVPGLRQLPGVCGAPASGGVSPAGRGGPGDLSPAAGVRVEGAHELEPRVAVAGVDDRGKCDCGAHLLDGDLGVDDEDLCLLVVGLVSEHPGGGGAGPRPLPGGGSRRSPVPVSGRGLARGAGCGAGRAIRSRRIRGPGGWRRRRCRASRWRCSPGSGGSAGRRRRSGRGSR